jgi:hypothetical protein
VTPVGFFSGGVSFVVDDRAFSLAIADLDGDMDADIAVITQSSSGDTAVTVMLNNGAGLFPLQRRVNVPADTVEVVIGEVTGDSLPDLIVSTGADSFTPTRGGRVSYLSNAGAGTFGPAAHLSLDDAQYPLGFALFQEFQVFFDEVGGMDQATLLDGDNYQLVEAGPDGRFDKPGDPSPDDRIIALRDPVLTQLEHGHVRVALPIATGELPLPAGKYRLTLKGTSTIRDADGNPLNDANGDGVGADLHKEFEIIDHGPVIVSQFPSFDAGPVISQLFLEFSKPIAPASFTVDDITSFIGPNGPIVPTSVIVTQNIATISFPEQTTRGFYSLQVGPDILDLLGNPMNQNFNAVFGEPFGDGSTRFFTVTLTQFDQAGFLYDWSDQDAAIIAGGRVGGPTNEARPSAFVNALQLSVDGIPYAGLGTNVAVENDGRTLIFPVQTLAGLDVRRKAYVPASDGNFARVVDVFHNPTGATISVPVTLSGRQVGLEPVSVTATSSGDTTLSAADHWFAADDMLDGEFAPEVAFVIQDGAGLVQASEAAYNALTRLFGWQFDVTVAPGETIRLLSFAIQTTSRDAAAAEAAALAALPFRALAFLSVAEQATVVNFQIGDPLRLAGAFDTPATPAAPPPTDVELTRLLDAAVSWWVAAGLDPNLAGPLHGITLQLAELPLDTLGWSSRDQWVVFLDRDAAGQGWFIDPSPGDSDEFEWNAEIDWLASDPAAASGVDLLTAIMHELGHLLGAEHSESGLLSPRLRPGVRRLPHPADVDALFGRQPG